jgi:zinc protease
MIFRYKRSIVSGFLASLSVCFGFPVDAAFAQQLPPAPQVPKSISIPAVQERKLPNGLTVAVVERKNVPLVTVQLVVKSGAERERMEKAGLANMTASLLTKGTKTRTATQIAEEMEFLGATISAGAGWNNSVVGIDVMSDKLDRAMSIIVGCRIKSFFQTGRNRFAQNSNSRRFDL